MGYKLLLIFALLALAMVAGTTATMENGSWGLGRDRFVEDETEMLMDSDIHHRQLAGTRYISYGTLRRDSVPCNRRGQSYYNCNKRQKANPYRRGCSAITRCVRYTS